MEDILTPIKDWPKYYVSRLGKVYSDKAANGSRRELTPQLRNQGYYQVQLSDSEKGQHKFLVHRLVAAAFCENYTEDCDVHHIDRNKANNAADNLVCLTPEEHIKLHKEMSDKTIYIYVNGYHEPDNALLKEYHIINDLTKDTTTADFDKIVEVDAIYLPQDYKKDTMADFFYNVAKQLKKTILLERLPQEQQLENVKHQAAKYDASLSNEELYKAVKEGVKAKELAQRCNVSKASVEQRIRRMKLKGWL